MSKPTVHAGVLFCPVCETTILDMPDRCPCCDEPLDWPDLPGIKKEPPAATEDPNTRETLPKEYHDGEGDVK